VKKKILAGVAAGLAASWVMNRFQSMVKPEQEQHPRGKPEEQGGQHAKQHRQPTVEIADWVMTAATGRHLTRDEEKVAGPLVHYVYGAAIGGLYGYAATRNPKITAAAGLPFGVAAWIFADELPLPLFGLSEPPWKYPASMHAYSLASHVVYGVTTEVVRRGLS
jgi:putative membrane protein